MPPQGCCGAGTPQVAIKYLLLFQGDVWVLAGGGLVQGGSPSTGTLGLLLGNGNAAVLPQLRVMPSRPPACAIVTLRFEGRHARTSTSFGFSTYMQISSC